MAFMGRAHVIKAALVAAILLVLLNLYNYCLESKQVDNPSSMSIVGGQQWPKRTHSSYEIAYLTNMISNNNNNQQQQQQQNTINNNTNSTNLNNIISPTIKLLIDKFNNTNYNINGKNITTINNQNNNTTDLNNINSIITTKTTINSFSKNTSIKINNNNNNDTNNNNRRNISSHSVILDDNNSKRNTKYFNDNNNNNFEIENTTSTINNNNTRILNNNNGQIAIDINKLSSYTNNKSAVSNNNKIESLEIVSDLIKKTATAAEAPAPAPATIKPKFLEKFMTTLGLSTISKCPAIPPNLDGPIEVNTTVETIKLLEQRSFTRYLLPGGWYKPRDCKAHDRVAIVIPYRDRATHLPVFLANLHPFLQKQQIEYGIFVVEQIADGLFNRAALMNVGFVEALKLSNWDCFIFHDIDLLPMDDRNLYTCPDQPRHMSVAVDTMGFKLPYTSIFGGVSALTVKQFKTVNGFSNSFWGWGGEDDDMSNRLSHVGFHIARYPVNIARYTMLNHKKEKANPKRYENLVNGAKKYDIDGLNSLKYKVHYLEKKILYTWIVVELKPDMGS